VDGRRERLGMDPCPSPTNQPSLLRLHVGSGYTPLPKTAAAVQNPLLQVWLPPSVEDHNFLCLSRVRRVAKPLIVVSSSLLFSLNPDHI
jgi:hypothetical protein